MSYRTSSQSAAAAEAAAAEVEDRQQADRFSRGGEDLLASAVMLAELARERLGGERGEELARVLAEITAKTVARALEIEDKRRDLSARLPNPIREPVLRHFVGRKRGRAMTGTEAAEAALHDRNRVLRRERNKAQDAQRRRIEFNAEAQTANDLRVGNYITLGQELRSQEHLSQDDMTVLTRLEELAELEETGLAEKEDDDIQWISIQPIQEVSRLTSISPPAPISTAPTRRSGRAAISSRAVQSQLSQERHQAAAKEAKTKDSKKERKGRRMHKAVAEQTTQLNKILQEYVIPIRSSQ
jgi:hypothetical protein